MFFSGLVFYGKNARRDLIAACIAAYSFCVSDSIIASDALVNLLAVPHSKQISKQ